MVFHGSFAITSPPHIVVSRSADCRIGAPGESSKLCVATSRNCWLAPRHAGVREIAIVDTAITRSSGRPEESAIFRVLSRSSYLRCNMREEQRRARESVQNAMQVLSHVVDVFACKYCCASRGNPSSPLLVYLTLPFFLLTRFFS